LTLLVILDESFISWFMFLLEHLAFIATIKAHRPMTETKIN
jgi:hypothetical protein